MKRVFIAYAIRIISKVFSVFKNNFFFFLSFYFSLEVIYNLRINAELIYRAWLLIFNFIANLCDSQRKSAVGCEIPCIFV